MAVSDKSDKNQNPQQQAPYQGQSQAPQQPQPQPQGGLGNINSYLPRSGTYDHSESRSSDALRSLKIIERRAQESQALGEDHELIRFDRDANRVGLPAILVTKTIKFNNKIYTAVRSLILDSDGIRLQPRIEQFGPQRIETPTLPQDVYNDVYWSRITDMLRRTKGVTDLIVVDAGALVVPSDFVFKEDDNEMALAQLLITSVNRCDDIIAMVTGESPFNVGMVKRQDERLSARLDFGGEPVQNVVAQPIRSDIAITMSRQPTAQVQKEQDYYERETSFNSVTGFINLEYSPQPLTQQPNMGWGQPQGPQPIFTPTFVITDVSQANWIRALTPELYLLAISNAFRVTANTAWARSFMPRVGRKGVDPKDIGALGYLTQAGKMIETKSDAFTEDDFVKLMTALVRPNPTFLIDINPVGEHAAVENYFIDAAFDGPNKAKAYQKLVEAANNLTGGHFAQHWKTNESIVVPYQEIHMGWYVDGDGDRRDIRDLDVLAMLNHCEGNIQDFMEWYRTFVDANIHPTVRMNQRERLERQVLDRNMHITGRAWRLLLTPAFIEALDLATRAAGVKVDMENVTTILGGQRFMGNTLVNEYMVSRNAQFTTYGQSPAGSPDSSVYSGGLPTSGRMY